jgi:hypothetical protein
MEGLDKWIGEPYIRITDPDVEKQIRIDDPHDTAARFLWNKALRDDRQGT